jgi:hypothetical protein
MGVKTTLAGITFTAGDKTQAEALGTDLTGFMELCTLKCQELTEMLTFLNTDILTPAGDSSNASTITTQITNLS